MTGIRKLKKEDVLAIRDSLVERGEGRDIPDSVVDFAVSSGNAYTYVKDGIAVGCCGAVSFMDVWNMWAIYSDKSAIMTRARAASAFCKKFRSLLPGQRGIFSIPSDLCNGAKYAKFLGGVYKMTVPSEMFSGITNDIYEVA